MHRQLPNLAQRDHLLGEIRNYYWHVRALRPGQGARRRWLYRRIAKLRLILLEDGLDPELLRLYCRAQASLDRAAVRRFMVYLRENYSSLQKTHMAFNVLANFT